jgi:hypothetical protein
MRTSFRPTRFLVPLFFSWVYLARKQKRRKTKMTQKYQLYYLHSSVYTKVDILNWPLADFPQLISGFAHGRWTLFVTTELRSRGHR